MNFSELQRFLDRLTNWRIPGNAISVYQNHKEIFRYSSGYADVENGIKMTGEEYFNIYSCSKPATAVAALQLYEKGMFLLDDPLYEFIPEFKTVYCRDENGNVKKAENPITMRQLFAMTSGLTYNLTSDGIKEAKAVTGGMADTVTTAKYIAKDILAFEPGTRWEYGLSHDVLAAAVEVISGQRFSEYVNKNIFEPIGAKVYYHRKPELDIAPMYEYVTEDADKDAVSAQFSNKLSEGHWVKRDAYNIGDFEPGCEYDSGGAGIVTTMSDYVKFADALAMGGAAANGEQILTKGTIELMCTNQLDGKQIKGMWEGYEGYGYGLGVRTVIDRAQSGFTGKKNEFGWGGAAGAIMASDTEDGLSYFYVQHMLNPQQAYIRPRLRNVVYSCINNIKTHS